MKSEKKTHYVFLFIIFQICIYTHIVKQISKQIYKYPNAILDKLQIISGTSVQIREKKQEKQNIEVGTKQC